MTTKDLKAQIKAAMACLIAVGAKPTSVTCHADGSFTVLTGEVPTPPLEVANEDDWLQKVGDHGKAKRKTGYA